MALTLQEPLRPYKPVVYGTAFRLTPSRDANGVAWRYGFEFQRAPDSGGSPGTPIDIYVANVPLPSSGGIVIDPLPASATYYHYRWRQVGPGYSPGAYSSYIKRAAAELPQAVIDVAVNNGSVYPLARDIPWSDGKYAVAASASDGLTADSAVKDSTGGEIRKAFHKTAHTDPDTLDSVGDGATYARPLATRISAGKPLIDFAEAIHANKQIDNIADGSTYARILGAKLSSGAILRSGTFSDGKYAVAATATDGLTADSAVKDSAARAINTMFGKSSDDLDDVTDGPSYKRVSGVGSDNKATNGSLKLAKTRVILSAGSSWSVPSDFNPFLNSIEMIGGGGSGAPGVTNTNAGGGGGGGEYRRLVNFDPVGLASIAYSIGAGSSSSSPGGDTSWNSGMVLAKGGSSSITATGAAGGTGGTGGDGKNGGTGGNGSSGTGNRGGGGGGGAAGAHSVGNAGANAVGATAGAGGAGGSPNGGAAGTAGGGNGGDGTTWGGTDGPGGGGGGGNSAVLDGGTGGEWGGSSGGGGSTAASSGSRTNGKNGVIVITYYAIENT